MALFNNKEECCGCSACKSICPKAAILMVPDEEGFLYPTIDKSKCIDCGKCADVCAFRNGYCTANNFEEPLVYAVRHKDVHEIETSRSGAMFIALSDYILQNNGIVYGVGYIDHFRVVHKRATTKKERNEFKGSKYVQSDINNTFEHVKEDLRNGLTVLFSGTPCQTAGLYSYLRNNNTEMLFVCDIVCHGAPSPFIWRDYLSYIEKKYRDKVIATEFRDKSFGWVSHIESFDLEKSKKKITSRTFADLFYKHVMLRPSCGVCKYTNFKRPSDATLADYWGWEKISSDFNADDKGVSLVLLNTQKGKEFFEKVKEDVDYLESCIGKCMQPNLQQPSKISALRTGFWKNYKKYGFLYVKKIQQ
jgi:coenzyme F420-reducing hydrogenase beta subunit